MNSQQFNDWLKKVNGLTNANQLPLIMGIVNITPDSFADGGQYLKLEDALAHARRLIEQGADILDLGGESSRPGAKPISVGEEIARVIPVIKKLREISDICLSIDTTKPCVMQAALEAGANIINDITALKDNAMLDLVARAQIPVCLMHMKGKPATMQANPIHYDNIINEINDFFEYQIKRCLLAGVTREKIILDPGFGFGKEVKHNLQLIKHFYSFKQHGLPLMLGVSRKSTIGKILNEEPKHRLVGSLALTAYASLQGLQMIRTHDVKETKQTVVMLKEIMQVDNDINNIQTAL